MNPNTFVMPFSLFSSFWIILLRLNPEVRGFACSGIRRKDCEGTMRSYPLGETIVAESRLTSVIFCALLEWLNWWLLPR